MAKALKATKAMRRSPMLKAMREAMRRRAKVMKKAMKRKAVKLHRQRLLERRWLRAVAELLWFPSHVCRFLLDLRAVNKSSGHEAKTRGGVGIVLSQPLRLELLLKLVKIRKHLSHGVV